MAKGAAKLKAVEPEPELSPERQALIAAFDRVASLEKQIAASEAEISEGHGKIRELEKLIADLGDRIMNAHPSEKRALRKQLDEAKEDRDDWEAHTETLKMKRGYPPYVDISGSLSLELSLARSDIKGARSAFLKANPAVLAAFERVRDLRVELFQATADAMALATVGGVPAGFETWENAVTGRTDPNPALAAWIAELAVNPNAELAE